MDRKKYGIISEDIMGTLGLFFVFQQMDHTRNIIVSVQELMSALSLLFIFQQMDHNRDGVISVEEFMDTCQRVNTASLILIQYSRLTIM